MTFEYEFPFLAHATMEPMNCTINYDGKTAEIWAGHQMPTTDRDTAMKVLGLPAEKINVHTVYGGGSFGRRANKNSDFVQEACALAKIVKKPLKITWTREDDMRGGYYRPMNYHTARVGLDAKNNILAWDHHVVGGSVVGGSIFENFIVKNGLRSDRHGRRYRVWLQIQKFPLSAKCDQHSPDNAMVPLCRSYPHGLRDGNNDG